MMNLKQERLRRGLSLKQVAQATGLSVRTIIRIENDQRLGDVETLAKLAEFYGIPLENLVKERLKVFRN